VPSNFLEIEKKWDMSLRHIIFNIILMSRLKSAANQAISNLEKNFIKIKNLKIKKQILLR